MNDWGSGVGGKRAVGFIPSVPSARRETEVLDP